MCFTIVVTFGFKLHHPVTHPFENIKEGFIESYQHVYSKKSAGHSWFLFYLYGYSMLMLSIFDKYHPKHRNGKSLEQNNCEHNVVPNNYEDFSSLVAKLVIGRMKIAIVPGLVITAIDILRACHIFENDHWHSTHWSNHILYTFLYFLGYALMSVPPESIDEILEKNALYYFVSGIVLLLFGQANNSLGALLPTSLIINKMFLNTLTGFGKWLFILGSYGAIGKVCAKNIGVIGFLRLISMPFYLLHGVVLAGIRAVAIVMVLRLAKLQIIPSTTIKSDIMFPLFVYKLICGTLCTGIISYIITKCPSPVKYVVGLASPRSNERSNYWLEEYGIFISLLFIRIVGYLIVKGKLVESQIQANYFI